MHSSSVRLRGVMKRDYYIFIRFRAACGILYRYIDKSDSITGKLNCRTAKFRTAGNNSLPRSVQLLYRETCPTGCQDFFLHRYVFYFSLSSPSPPFVLLFTLFPNVVWPASANVNICTHAALIQTSALPLPGFPDVILADIQSPSNRLRVLGFPQVPCQACKGERASPSVLAELEGP